MKIINIDREIGGWWGITASWLRSLLPKDKDEAVTIKLNTPGGDVFEGFKIYQLLKDYSNVTVEIGALVASAGTYAILSAKKILAKETSTVMIHKAWGIAIGNDTDMEKEAEILNGIDVMIAKTYAKRNKSTQKKMLKAMADETWFFGGEAIKAFGLADDVIIEEEAEDVDETMLKASVNTSLKNLKNELTRIKMGENPPENKNLSNSIKKEEPELKNDKKKKVDTDQPTNDVETFTQNDIDNAVMAERSRMNQILNVSGLKMSTTVANALNSDTSYADFCIALAETSKEETAPETVHNVTNVAAIGSIAPAPEARETVPKDLPLHEKIAAELDAAVKASKGGYDE